MEMEKKINEIEFLARVEEHTKGRALFSLKSQADMGMMSVKALVTLCSDRLVCKSQTEIDNIVTMRKNTALKLRKMQKRGVSVGEMNHVLGEHEKMMKNKEYNVPAATLVRVPSDDSDVVMSHEKLIAMLDAEREKLRNAERKRLEEEDAKAMARRLEELLLDAEMEEMEEKMASYW